MLALGGNASAQVNTSADPRVDAVNFVTGAVEAFNNNTGRFQALRMQLADMHPLDQSKLDSNTIYENLQSLMHFQQFLEGYRQKDILLMHRLQDSVGLLEARLGDSARWMPVDRFFQDMKRQSAIFVQYSLKCSNYVMAIRSALVFLQNAGFDIIGGAVHVRGGADARDQYATLVNKMRAAETAMQEAFQKTLDATKPSNELVRSVVDQLGR